jgi:transcriptional regulator with XRE-family HTH domain
MISPLETEQQLVTALAKARLQQGLTYNDVAARTGLHYTAISLIERGKRHMTLIVFLKICAALGLDPASLFGDMLSPTAPLPTTNPVESRLHEKIRPLNDDK